MKLIFSSADPLEVGLLKSIFDQEGIANEIRNETIYPNIPGAAFQPELWVLNDEDLKSASELLDAWKHSQPQRAEDNDVQRKKPMDRSGTVGAITGALLFLGSAYLMQKKYLQSTAVEYRIWALLLSAIAAGFVWLAIIVWPQRKDK